jgi:carboxyl-terminal processing protease
MKKALLSTSLAGALTLGYFLGQTAPAPAEAASTATYDQLRLFSEVLGQIQTKYVSPTDDKKLIEDAIAGMLQGLDPHSSYMNPQQFAALQADTRGEYVGVGISIRMDEALGVLVQEVFEGGPASDAGVRVGDILTTINGEATTGFNSDDVINRLRGQRGETVVVGIARTENGATTTLSIELIRDTIKTPAVEAAMPVPGYAHIRLRSFQSGAADEIRTALDQLTAQNQGQLTGLVLDLRDNPGGLLSEARAVSNLFLDRGVIVTSRYRNAEDEQQMLAAPAATVYRGPLVVLVNNGSASASEIVAGALQDHRRAVLVGTQTYGKGSVQTTMELPEGSGLKLTVALYYTPSGRSIQNDGITPDFVVPAGQVQPDNTRLYGEADFENTIANPNPDAPVQFDMSAVTDAQLAAGIRQLRAFSIFSAR